MKRITITDISLLKNFNSDNSLTFKEKLDVAKMLNDVGVDVIALPSVCDKSDEVLIKTISTCVKKSTIAIFVKNEEELEKNYKLISNAKNKKVILSFPTSSVEIEYSFGKKPKAVLELIGSLTKKSLEICQNTQVYFSDAMRADFNFLVQAINCAIDNGIKNIALSDLAGNITPFELYDMLNNIYQAVPRLNEICLGLYLSNTFSFGISNCFAGIDCGATEIFVSAVDGCNMINFKEFANAMEFIGSKHGYETKLNKTVLNGVLTRISAIKNNTCSTKIFQSNEVENLDGDYSLSNLKKMIKMRGYDLSDEDLRKIHGEIIRLSERKTLTTKDLDAVIANTAMQVEETYTLDKFMVNSSNVLTATSNIVLKKNGKELSGLSFGNGCIDSAFRSLENIIGEHFELDDFYIDAVTEGKEAVGQAVVKLRYNGNVYSGRGISTDIVGASIRAYVNAVNKIEAERKN